MSAKIKFRKKKHILGRTTTFTTKASDYVPKIIHFSLFTVFTDVFDLMLVLLANKIVAFSAFELQFIVHLFSLDLVCAGTNNSFHAFEAPTRLCSGILDIRFPWNLLDTKNTSHHNSDLRYRRFNWREYQSFAKVVCEFEVGELNAVDDKDGLCIWPACIQYKGKSIADFRD